MKNDITFLNNRKIPADYFMIDAELLPLVHDANEGCLYSQMMLAHAFGQGEGAKKDRELETKYEEMIFETTDNNVEKVAVLWNAAMKEKDREKKKEKFNVVIDFMQEHLPMEEWDFELFAIMESHIQGEIE